MVMPRERGNYGPWNPGDMSDDSRFDLNFVLNE